MILASGWTRPYAWAVSSPSLGLPRKGVHRRGQRNVLLRQSFSIMGRESNLDTVIDVEPFRMVIELFGEKGASRHETESGVEILEDKSPHNRIPA